MAAVHYLDFDEPLFRMSAAYHLLSEMIEVIHQDNESQAMSLSGISTLLLDSYEMLQKLQAQMQQSEKQLQASKSKGANNGH